MTNWKTAKNSGYSEWHWKSVKTFSDNVNYFLMNEQLKTEIKV